MRRVLQLAAYRRLLAAYTLNQLAWQIGTLALAYLVYRRTGSALGSTTFFLMAQFVPALISPAVVARLDRFALRSMLPGLYMLEALGFLALAWMATHFTLPLVLALALADGVIALSARALARSATVEVTTAAGLLREGNALANTLFSLCFMAGPALGAGLVVAAGPSAALLVNSGLFALMALTLATTKSLPGGVPNSSPAAGRVRAALRLARDQPPIRTLLGVQAAALLFFTMPTPIEVVFAQHTLHAGAGGYGALITAWGAGAIAGSAIYARWRELPARELIVLGILALGAGFVGMALAPTLGVAIVGSAVAGVGNGVEAVAARTALQEQVEQQWMALMMSLYESLHQSVPGLGILLGGVIATLSGTRAALALAGAGALAVAAFGWIVLRPGSEVGAPRIDHPQIDSAGPGT